MKKVPFYLLVIFSFGLILVGSCKQETSFPIVPALTFGSFKIFGHDSAICKVNFTDGDGDDGLDPFDTLPPYNLNSRYNSDLFLVYFYYDVVTKTWLPRNLTPSKPTFDTLQFRYRIPNLSQNGQKQSLQGEIKVLLRYPYAPDTLFRFKITFVDRALHQSNTVDTGPISLH